MSTLKLLILYMALVKVGYAQGKYPLLSLDLKGDTVVTLSMKQLHALNVQLTGLDSCSKGADATESALKACMMLSAEKTKVIEQYMDITAKRDSTIAEDQLIFKSHNKIVAEYQLLDKRHVATEKGLRKRVVIWKTSFGVALGAGILALAFIR